MIQKICFTVGGLLLICSLFRSNVDGIIVGLGMLVGSVILNPKPIDEKAEKA